MVGPVVEHVSAWRGSWQVVRWFSLLVESIFLFIRMSKRAWRGILRSASAFFFWNWKLFKSAMEKNEFINLGHRLGVLSEY
jgi:hypothetical protein